MCKFAKIYGDRRNGRTKCIQLSPQQRVVVVAVAHVAAVLAVVVVVVVVIVACRLLTVGTLIIRKNQK